MAGIELAPGSKIFTARCKNLYVLTTKHKITAKNKINKIKIENPFEQIVTVIDNNDYSYKEIDIEEDLEIVKERLSTSKRTNNEIPQISSKMSTSRRIDKMEEEIKPYHYYITGIMEQRKYLILINTGQEENYITRELVTEDEIITTEQLCPELPKELINTEETTEKEIIIGGIPIVIKFKIYHGDKNIILGIKWLEQVKPYNLEDKQLTINYENKKLIIKKIINRNLMTKLAICNMCYIDEYTCAFREFYYKGTYNTEESKEIRKLYFTKLPEPFSSKIIKDWNEAGLADTLGARMKFLQRWFIELCEKHKEEIKMEKILVKNLACCKNKIAPQFGCTDRYYKKYNKNRNYRKYRSK